MKLSYCVKSASKVPAAPFLRPGPQKSWLSHEPDMARPRARKGKRRAGVSQEASMLSMLWCWHLAQFGPIWPNVAQFGPIWPNLAVRPWWPLPCLPPRLDRLWSLSTFLNQFAHVRHVKKPCKRRRCATESENPKLLGIQTLCKNNRHTTVTGWHDLES